MKKATLIFFSILAFTIISFVIYWNLPLDITHESDIKLGNKLIENIDLYKIQNNKVPDYDDMKTLEQLGFKIEILGSNPSYVCNQKGEYEIVFVKDFDGPYLMWNSKEKKWKFDSPTIFK